MNKIISRDIIALLLIFFIHLYMFSMFFGYNHAKNMLMRVKLEKQSDEFIYNLSNNSENSKILLSKENGQESLQSLHNERHMSYGLDFELEYDSGNIRRTREVRSDPGERSLESDCEASMMLPLIDTNKKLSQGVLMIETSGENMRMSLTRKIIKCIRSIIPYSKTSLLSRISCQEVGVEIE